MKILLLNPPFKTEYGQFSRDSRSPAVTKSGTLYYPIWLAYAAGTLEKAGFDVKIIDSCAGKYGLDRTLQLVKEYFPKLIVVNTSTPSIYNDIQIASTLKDSIPGVFVVLTGTHVSALPEETLQFKNNKADAIARQEYDFTIKELAQTVSRNKLNDDQRTKVLSGIDGISFLDGDKVIHTKDRAYIEDLDSLPFVSGVYKKHLDINQYFFSAGQFPMVMIMTGRGCPARCSFCVYPQTFHGRVYRYRSPENVVAEFQYIVNSLPTVKSIGIEDDTFTMDKNRVQSICEKLIELGISKKVNWWVNTRVNTLDYETMCIMREAGCRLIIPGFESGSQQVLNAVRKGTKLDQAINFSKNAHKTKLLVHGCFMVGNPSETKETMQQTLEFAKKLNPDTAQFFPLIVYPGTEAYNWTKENGYLNTKKYSDWVTEEGLHNCVINLPNISSQQLVQFCDRARREFYLRPKYILQKAAQVLSNPSEFKRTVKAFKVFLKYLFKK